MWFPTAKKLLANYRLVMVDFPGFGKSKLLHKPYTITDLADLILEVVSRLNITSFHLIGHSMGGYVGLEFLSRYPEKVKSLGLIHSHCFTDTDEKIANRRKSVEFVKRHGASYFLQEFYTNLFAPDTVSRFNDKIVVLRKKYKYIKADAIIQGAEEMIKRKDHSETLKKCTVPVFMFCGKDDPAVSYTQSLVMASFPAFCDFHLIEGMGHVGFIESPRKWMSALDEFLKLAIRFY